MATNGTGTGGTTQVVVQKVSSWADECDDDDDRPTRHEVIELPTAPRSARIFEDDSIPYNPPFVAKVSNLPFDTNEGEVEDFFIDKDIVVKEMRLARDDNRLRGFGQIEFEGREDLISALMIPDATIRNRRVRIELATENDNRDKGRRRFDYGPRDGNNDNTNWRDRKESSSGGGGFDDSRRDRDRDSRRGGDYNRSNFQNRHDSNNNDDIVGGWRMGERQLDSSPPPERRRGGFDRNDRNDRSDRNDRRSGSGRDKYERGPAPDEERPVLNLAPRTKPMPVLVFPAEKEIERSSNRRASIENEDDNAEIHSNASNENRDEKEPEVKIVPKPKPVPNAAVFGDAKPVDTAAREREIEAKMDERKARNEAERDERDTDNSEQPEIKKDIIVIKTEKVRLQEEASNWRQHATSDDSSSDPPKNRDNNGRRFNDRRSKFQLS